MGNYTKSSRDIYLFSPICLDLLVNSMDSKLDWSHFSLNFLPRQIWKNTTQLLFVVRNACCFFPVWRKSKCVDLFHGDLCMGPHTHTHTFQGNWGSFVRHKDPDVWSKASEISAETSTHMATRWSYSPWISIRTTDRAPLPRVYLLFFLQTYCRWILQIVKFVPFHHQKSKTDLYLYW